MTNQINKFIEFTKSLEGYEKGEAQTVALPGTALLRNNSTPVIGPVILLLS